MENSNAPEISRECRFYEKEFPDEGERVVVG